MVKAIIGTATAALVVFVLTLGMPGVPTVFATSSSSPAAGQASATLFDRVSAAFHKAREDYLNDNLSAAAAAVDQGAADIKLETDRATDQGKKILSRATAELTKLAKDLRKGAVSSVNRLNNTFADVHWALAAHHHSKAAEDWAAAKSAQAGRDMKAASNHLQSAWAWANKRLDRTTSAALKEARDIGSKLAADGKVTEDKVNEELAYLELRIRSFVTGDSLAELAAAGEPSGFVTWSGAMSTKLTKCGYKKESAQFTRWLNEFMKSKGWTKGSYDQALEKGDRLAGFSFTPNDASCERVKATYDFLLIAASHDLQADQGTGTQ